MKQFIQFGAGSIGRSLCGPIFSRAEYEVIFVDVDQRIIDALNSRRSYTVEIKDRVSRSFEVKNVRAVNGRDAAAVREVVATAELAGTAVGAAGLPAVARAIAAALPARQGRSLNIILCENLAGAADLVRTEIERITAPATLADLHVGLAETSIGKMAPIMPASVREQDPTLVWGEAYEQIIADRRGFVTPPPEIKGLVTKDNFQAWVERKLYVHNLGHAACAYLGFLAGCAFIWEAVAIPSVREVAEGAMRESGRALLAAYPGEWTDAEMEDHIQDLLSRFSNRVLNDTVFRVGRDLKRKLAPSDRVMGALSLQRKTGVSSDCTIRVLVAALKFKAADESGARLPGDIEVTSCAETEGAAAALIKYAGLSPTDPIVTTLASDDKGH